MTIRWGRALADPVPVNSKIRWGRGISEGTAPTTGAIRWGRAATEGTAAVTVNPLPNLADVEPETVLTVTAGLAGGGTADPWTWRVVAGPPTTIVGTGATVDITAPSHINGTTVTIGVRATKDGTVSPEVTFTIGVRPQTEWWWTGTGWIPKVEVWA